MMSIINLNLNPMYLQQSVCKCISWHFNWSIHTQCFKIFLGYKYWTLYTYLTILILCLVDTREIRWLQWCYSTNHIFWFDLQQRYHNLEQAKYSSTKAQSTSNRTILVRELRHGQALLFETSCVSKLSKSWSNLLHEAPILIPETVNMSL